MAKLTIFYDGGAGRVNTVNIMFDDLANAEKNMVEIGEMIDAGKTIAMGDASLKDGRLAIPASRIQMLRVLR